MKFLINIIIFNPLLRFKLTLITRLFIAVRSNSRIIIWVRLELNILRFLPIITSSEYSPIENSIKYFLIQSAASILYIISVLLCLIKYVYSLEVLIIVRIIIKIGAAPFHGWFLSLSKSLRLFVLLLLSTVQKIIPVLITSILNMVNAVITLVCIITFLVIFYNRIMILRLIKILALSGINNLVWFLVRIIAGIQFFYLLLTIYRYLHNVCSPS